MQKKSNSQLIYRSYISHCVKECEVFNETEIHLHSFAHKIIQKKIKLWMWAWDSVLVNSKHSVKRCYDGPATRWEVGNWDVGSFVRPQSCWPSEPCVFQQLHPLGSPVWLEGDFVVARHLTKIFLQLSEELLVTFCLVQRHKGVNVGKLVPGDWLQERRRERFFFSLTSIHNWYDQ